MPTADLPIHVAFSSRSDFWASLPSLALARFLSGEEPAAELLQFEGVARADDLVPIASVVWRVKDEHSERVLARGDGWSLCVGRHRNGAAEVSATAVTPEVLAKVVADVRSRAPVIEPKPEVVHIEFWYQGGGCGDEVTRRIDAPRWEEVAHHYTASVRAQLGTLMGMEPPGPGGRLLLWHGPPGTGKTSAIRALAREWSRWCRTLFVVDPERLLGNASYLMSLLLGADDYDEEEAGAAAKRRSWRLVVIEDADELLRADAKRQTGQSLSRLLNVSDGLIGQGVDLLVLLTTNEPVGRLHPAVVRPGRCLAEVEFRPLTREEAAALLDAGPAAGAAPGAAGGELTLAEVFERRGAVARIGGRAGGGPVGQYL